MKNGVPFDIAFRGIRIDIDEETAAWWAILFSEMDGASFNWGTFDFEKPA